MSNAISFGCYGRDKNLFRKYNFDYCLSVISMCIVLSLRQTFKVN